jgi:MmoB/DmpM family
MDDGMAEARVVETDSVSEDGVGPILRAGEIADAVIEAIAEDNPGKEIFVVDRGDYLRINTLHECRLSLASLKKHLGRDYSLTRLEIEMPSFAGRIRTSDNEIVWFHSRT